MSWPEIKKIVILKCHLLLFYATTTNCFSAGLWRVTKNGLYTTSSVVGLRRSSKALPRAKLAPIKGHGHCLVVCCPSDPLQISESWWNCYICEVCSANPWEALKIATPAAGIGQHKGPSSQCLPAHGTASASKVKLIWLQSLAMSPIFTWPLANW